jgi:cytochrome c biogenesis protein CcmG/thiol:disulfide interchange protein DsbE
MTKQTTKAGKLRFLIPVIAFIGFALIAAFGLFGTINGTRNSDQLPSVLIGKMAPELPASALNDELARPLSDFAGKPVLVNVMASWCAPCRAELPALDLLSKDVAVIAIAYKDKREDTADFLAQYGNPFAAVWMDYDGTNGIKWGIYGVPETFLLDGQGRVILRHAGPIFKDTVTNVIRPALAELAR